MCLIDNLNIHTQNVIKVNSAMSFMGCHQMSKNEFTAYGYKDRQPNIISAINKKSTETIRVIS